jgi:hypothetical protein
VEGLELVKNRLFVTEDHVSELREDVIDPMGKNRRGDAAEEASRKPMNWQGSWRKMRRPESLMEGPARRWGARPRARDEEG